MAYLVVVQVTNYQLRNCGSISDHLLHKETFFLDIEECTSSPCQHSATCVDEVNGYSCICVDGWTGLLCETSKYYSFFRKCQLGHYKRIINYKLVIFPQTKKHDISFGC